jgi:hypothetical protein
LNIDSTYLDLIFKDEDTNIYYEYTPSSDIYSGSFTSSEYKATSLEYGIDNEKHYIAVDTKTLVEIPISFVNAYNTNYGIWSVGANIKPMKLVTTSQKFSLGVDSDTAVSDDATYETIYKSTIGLDLGLAYRKLNSKVTFGLIGKNINSPTFEVESSTTGVTKDYVIKPFFRAGVSIPIFNDTVEIAIDADLQKTDSLIKDDFNQFIGAGIGFMPSSWFSLRVGAMQDIASKKFNDGTIMTAGIGLGLKWAQIDVSAMVSTNTGEYEGDEIPRYTALNVSLISKWGEGYNKKIPTMK